MEHVVTILNSVACVLKFSLVRHTFVSIVDVIFDVGCSHYIHEIEVA